MLCLPPPSKGPPFAALVCISLSLAASAFCLACRRVHSAIGSAAAGVVVVRVEVVVREEETKPNQKKVQFISSRSR
mgnify:CR=1 FL=1